MHLYLYTAEDVDKFQYVQAALSSHTITLQEQIDYICYDVKMITNAVRCGHKFTNKRKLLIVFEGKRYNNNDNTNKERFINGNQVKKMYCKLNKQVIIFQVEIKQ